MRRRETLFRKSVSYLMAGVILLIFISLLIQTFLFVRKIYQDHCGTQELYPEIPAPEIPAPEMPVQKINTGPVTALPASQQRDRMKKHIGGHPTGDRMGKKYRPMESHRRKPRLLLNLNQADSAALLKLYGIGPYFAGKIVEYRDRLGGSYASVYQLQEIWGVDSSRFAGIVKSIYIDTTEIRTLDLYELSADSLARHPYIGPYAAKGVLRLRKYLSREEFTVDALLRNGIISEEKARGLRLYCK